MKHFTNKKTNEVYGYESIEDAKKYDNDFDNLVVMSDEIFEKFKVRPVGGVWTCDGWVIDNKLKKQEEEEKKQAKIKESKAKIKELMNEAGDMIEAYNDAIELGRIKTNTRKRLREWKSYRLDLLELLETDLTNPVYPKKPQD